MNEQTSQLAESPKPKRRFKISFSGDRKRAYIDGPEGFDLDLSADHDDVDQLQVRRDLKKLCLILDRHW